MGKISRKPGFTLVETMIVVSIVGLLASLSIPSMRKSGQKARARRFAREIKVAAHAFVQYSFDYGGYPPDKTPAQMPAGMEEYLAKFPWSEPTVIGGLWDWDHRQFGFVAGVSVYRPEWSPEQMLEIDGLIDDGNLDTGDFRRRADGYIYIIEH